MPWDIPDGKSGQQAVEFLQQRVELLGAVKTGNWSIDCETYHSVSAHSKSLVTGALTVKHTLYHSVSAHSKSLVIRALTVKLTTQFLHTLNHW